jgi:hypothetical protein
LLTSLFPVAADLLSSGFLPLASTTGMTDFPCCTASLCWPQGAAAALALLTPVGVTLPSLSWYTLTPPRRVVFAPRATLAALCGNGAGPPHGLAGWMVGSFSCTCAVCLGWPTPLPLWRTDFLPPGEWRLTYAQRGWTPPLLAGWEGERAVLPGWLLTLPWMSRHRQY